jgi:hypothetical protein
MALGISLFAASGGFRVAITIGTTVINCGGVMTTLPFASTLWRFGWLLGFDSNAASKIHDSEFAFKKKGAVQGKSVLMMMKMQW